MSCLTVAEGEGSLGDSLGGIILRSTRRKGDFGYNIDRLAANLGNLLAASNRNEVTVPEDGEDACAMRQQSVTASQRVLGVRKYIPTIPNASNEVSGFDSSGTESLEVCDTDAVPYLIFTRGEARWGSFLE